MKRKTIGVLLIVGLVVLAAMAVFAGTAAAQEGDEDPFRIYGTITDADGNPYVGHEVIIKKQHDNLSQEVWRPLKGEEIPGLEGKYRPITNDTGYYDTGWCPIIDANASNQSYGDPRDNYRMYIDGDLVAERYIGEDDWDKSYIQWTFCWLHRWDYQIPEFATIAIPAVAVLGLFLFYSHRKRKEE